MEQTIATFDRAQALHRLVVENVLRIRDVNREWTMEEMVDVALGLRETSRLFDDCRKECDHCVEVLNDGMAIQWIAHCVQVGTDEPIRGEFAVGIVRTRQMMGIPKRDTDDYETLMKSLGVPEGDLVRPHWPSMVDHVSRLLSEGKPAPAGMTGKPYSVYSVMLRKRKEFHNVEKEGFDQG